MNDNRPRFKSLSWKLKLLAIAFLIPAEIIGWTLFAVFFLIAFVGSPRGTIRALKEKSYKSRR